MIDAVIIDDEQNNVEALQTLLAQFCPDVNVEGTALNTNAGITIIKKLQPELVFLDIEMPFGNAFDLLEKLMPVSFEVIFVTAFEQYAIRAIKYVALDYLLKPVSIEELKAAVEKARLRLDKKKPNTRIESLLGNFRDEPTGLKKIGLPVQEGFVFEEIENIIHLEAEGHFTYVFTTSDRKILVTKTLKDFDDILPPALFCRIHHSHIVNLNFIKKYYSGRGGYIELKDGTTVAVSTRKKEEFLEKFKI